MKSKNKARLFGVSELLLGLVITILIIMLANRYLSSIRLDMTENNIYTVSQGTKNILRDLSQPINLKLFYSKKLSTELPGIGVFADQVTDMLREYQRIASEKINLELIDPEPFSEAEDLAVANGLNGVPVDQQGNSFYFGLVATNAIDGRETIPFFTPEREQQLEYDLTRLIQRLSTNSNVEIGVLSALQVSGDSQAAFYGMPSQPWYSISQLDQLYELNYLDAEVDTIDPSLSVLLVIHPASLPGHTLFAIDQYALSGGKIMMFADPLAESEQSGNAVGSSAQSHDELDRMLTSWGLSLDKQTLVADYANAMRVQSNASNPGEVVDYPIWFRINQQTMNADEPVLQQLGDVIMASSGALNPVEDATTEFTSLLETSDTASLIDLQSVLFQSDPKEVLKLYQPGSEALTVAARVSGEAKSAFPDYKPEDAIDASDTNAQPDVDNEPDSDQAETLAENESDSSMQEFTQIESGEVNVVVFADTDFLRDQFWVQIQNFLGNQLAVPSAGNGTLIANMVDQMSGSPDLISVRNRGSANRPFTLLDSIRQRAEQNFLQKEQELISELEATENKLVELEQAKNSDNSALLSSDQQNELDSFTQKKLAIRKQLRQVRHSLQKDIERVETQVKVINIAMVPFIIILVGLFFVFLKSKRDRRHG